MAKAAIKIILLTAWGLWVYVLYVKIFPALVDMATLMSFDTGILLYVMTIGLGVALAIEPKKKRRSEDKHPLDRNSGPRGVVADFPDTMILTPNNRRKDDL